MGTKDDTIVQMDWMVGRITGFLEERDLAKNTVVLFTSESGSVLNNDFEDQTVEISGDRKPAGLFRGGKYSICEGGNRTFCKL